MTSLYYGAEVTTVDVFRNQDSVRVGVQRSVGLPGADGAERKPFVSSVKIWGDTDMNPDGPGTGPDESITSRLIAMLGVRPGQILSMGATSGTTYIHTSGSSYAKILQAHRPNNSLPYDPDGGPSFGKSSIDEMAVYGFGSPNFAKGYKESLKTIICRWVAAKVFPHNDASITTQAGSPTALLWSALTAPYSPAQPWGGGVGCWELDGTDALNVAVPADYPGGYADLVFIGGYAGATGDIRLDGNVVGSVDTGNMMLDSSGYENYKSGLTFRVPLSAGAHTIRITHTGAVNAGKLHFNEWSLAATTTPLTVIGDAIQPSAPYGAWAPNTSGRVAVFNGFINEVVSSFANDAIVVASANGAIGADPLNFADGLYLNSRGANIVADTFYEAMSQAECENRAVSFYWSGTGASEDIRATKWWSGLGPPGATVYSFPDADTAATLGVSGLVEIAGQWGISSNKAYIVSTAGGGAFSMAGKDFEYPDGAIEYTSQGTFQDFEGVFFRADPVSPGLNYWRLYASVTFGNWVLQKIVAGVALPSSVISGPHILGTKVRVEFVGPYIACYFDDILTSTGVIEDSTLLGNTVHGICGLNTGASRWDDVTFYNELGEDGDYYLDKTDGAPKFWGPKHGLVWASGTDLPVGPPGSSTDWLADVGQPTFADAFTRANGAPANGWVQAVGAIDISGNELKSTTVSGGVSQLVRPAPRNGSYQVTVGTATENNMGLLFRWIDATHYWVVRLNTGGGNALLYKNVGAGEVLVATLAAAPTAAGTVIKVEAEGNDIRVYFNAVLYGSATDAANNTGQNAGVAFASAGGAGRLDAFNYAVLNIEVGDFYLEQLSATSGQIWYNDATLGFIQRNTLAGIAGAAGANGTNGAPGSPRLIGAHSAVITYSIGDGVTYQGQYWSSKQNANLNHTPAEDAWWTLVAAKGDVGATGGAGPVGPAGANGTNGSPRWLGVWSNLVTYVVGDAVSNAGSSWVSIQNGNLAHTPADDTWWDPVALKGNTGATGAAGAAGPAGAAGADGQGVPTGGAAGDYLKKVSGTDFDTIWVANPAAGAIVASGFPANSMVIATALDTPVKTAIGTRKIIGRKATGDLGALDPVDIRTLLLERSDPSRQVDPLAPALYGKWFNLLGPSASNNVTLLGNAQSLTGTITTSVSVDNYGIISHYTSGAVAGNTAGMGAFSAHFKIGTTWGGIFQFIRFALPDASYGAGATGSRLFLGMTDTATTAMVGTDTPTGSYFGIQYSTNRGDTNWQLITRDGTTMTVANTGLAFTAQKAYELVFFVAKNTSTLHWLLRNITDGTEATGSTGTTLPAAATQMRWVGIVETLTTAARVLGINRIYTETER